MTSGWSPWWSMRRELRLYQMMGNLPALLLLLGIVIPLTLVIVYAVYAGFLARWEYIALAVGFDLLLAACAVYVGFRLYQGKDDVPFDESTHPMHRHPSLYADKPGKRYTHYCPRCLFQSNFKGRCPKCRAGRMAPVDAGRR